MGWTGAYPVLSRKRPTASLVSRKVLTPLLGQVVICIFIQAIGFEIVRQQPWYDQEGFDRHRLIKHRYLPPHLDREKSNITNSQNTTLFLLSCFQYILSAIVLSIGPPFRRSMAQNCKLTSSRFGNSDIHSAIRRDNRRSSSLLGLHAPRSRLESFELHGVDLSIHAIQRLHSATCHQWIHHCLVGRTKILRMACKMDGQSG